MLCRLDSSCHGTKCSLESAGGVLLKRSRSGLEHLIRVACLLIAVVMALFLLYQGGRWLERRSEKPEPRGDHTQRYAFEDLVEIDGVTYRQRTGLTTILLMGIDRESGTASAQGYRNGGQADFLRLLVIDDVNKTVTQIQIDRDTMTPITVLGVLGNKSGVRTAQICLSHGFGDGKAQSCELTVEAVSNLMFGIPIDFYVALNMDGISVLNDALGGVTVTLEDDFSALDPGMTKGTTLTLVGDQAEIYVRSRMNVGIGTNEARMARQELYISQVASLLLEQMEIDEDFVSSMYDTLSPYLLTDIPRGRLINEAWTAKDYDRNAAVKPDGTHEVGNDGFMQFHVAETALRSIVIDLFFEEVK